MKTICLLFLVFGLFTMSVNSQRTSATKTFKGYFQKISIGDVGVYKEFTDANGRTRSFRQCPERLLYFFVAHKGELLTVSYRLRRLTFNKEVWNEEVLVSASAGNLTDVLWWKGVRSQAIKDAEGNEAIAKQKLKKYYDNLVDRATQYF